jgi:hypothetical protein
MRKYDEVADVLGVGKSFTFLGINVGRQASA